MDREEKKTLLLVEDESLIAMGEKAQLERYGYSVVVASNGEKAALAIIDQSRIDLILMDINLGSGIDGTQAAEMILKNHDIPIVFLSSHTEPEIVGRTEKITSYGYVVKSSSMTVLDASIKMAFKLFDAHKKLEKANGKLEATLDALPDILFEVGLDGTYYSIHSPDLERLYRPISEQIGKKIPDVLPSEASNTIMAAIREANEKGSSYGKQFDILVPAGLRSIEVSIAPIFGHQDQPHFVFLAHDITDRKSTEQSLQESVERLSFVVHASNLGYSDRDMATGIIKRNERWAEMLGYKLAEFEQSKMQLKDLIHPEDYAEAERIAQEHLDGKTEMYKVKYRLRTKGGNYKWILDCGKAVKRDSEGKPLRVCGTHQDISDEMEYEERKREDEARSPLYSLLSSSLLDAIIMLDEGFAVSYWNNSAERMLGYSKEEVTGKDFHEMMVPEKYAGRYIPAHKHFILTGEGNAINKTIEAEVIHKDGHVVLVEMSLSAHSHNNRWISTAILRDISERKAIEKKLKDTLAEKEYILKEVHHRIKNNMNTLMSLLQLQMSTMKDPVAIDSLKDAENRLHSMAILYEKLYRSEDYGALSAREYIPMLAREIVAVFANGTNVEVEADVEPFTLTSKTMSYLGIIINEVITNSMKYAFPNQRKGVIGIRGTRTGNSIRIAIADNGIGMPPDIDIETSKGFGMFLLGTLTKQLGGTIKIERKNGTAFVLEFEKDEWE
ncbi:MAG: PAS domain S-box protein, partial [Spirochaetota bacterium]